MPADSDPDPTTEQDPTTETEQTYDRIAAEYAARTGEPSPELSDLLDRVVAATPRGGIVVELGCGPGHLVDLLRTGGRATGLGGVGPHGDGPHDAEPPHAEPPHAEPPHAEPHDAEPPHAGLRGVGLRGVGLDRSTAMLGLARSRGVPVVRGDLRRLPFGDGTLDAVLCVAALLHVPRAEVPATLAEWLRVTRPGGVLALATSLGDDEGWEVVPYAPDAGPTGGPLHRWFVHHDADALVGLVDGAGWRVDDVRFRTSNRRWVMIAATAAS